MRFVPARLSAYYVAHFFCTGVHLPFWSPWLASRGVAPETIGVLLALGYWVSIATSPLAGRAADRALGTRAPMTALAAIAAVGFVLFSGAREVAVLGVLAVVTFGAHAALLPLAESVTQARALAGDAFYGRVRLWGSLSFVAVSAGAGWLVGATSVAVVPWLLAGGSLACLAAAQLLPARAPVVAGVGGATAVDGAAALAPAAAPAPAVARPIAWAPLVAGIVLANAIQATHVVYYGFGTLHWQSAGIGDATIGALWSLGVVAEVVLFALSPSVMPRLGPAQLMTIGATAAALRWLALPLVDHVAAIAATQLLHALSFGATHLGGMELVRRALPAHRLASGQGLYTAIAGIAYGIATPIAGALYQHAHGAAYLYAAGLAGACAIAAAALAPAIVRRAGAREPAPRRE